MLLFSNSHPSLCSLLDEAKAVFFDLDDTLIPTSAVYESAFDLVATFLSCYTKHARDVIVRYQVLLRENPWDPEGKMSTPQWRIHLWARALAIDNVIRKDHQTTLATFLWHLWLAVVKRELKLSANVLTMLTRLRTHAHKRLVIITNGRADLQLWKMRAANVARLFDAVLIGDALSCGPQFQKPKPDVDIFKQACRAAGVQPHECIMVGDSLEHDMAGAALAGLRAGVWINSGALLQQPADVQHHESSVELCKNAFIVCRCCSVACLPVD